MEFREKAFEIGIAGLVAGGFSCGLIVLLRMGFPPDATLGFFGGIIGAAATVLGAVWIQDARNMSSRREEYRFLTRSLRPVEEQFAALRELADGGTATDATIMRAAETCTNLFEASKSTVEDVIASSSVMDNATKIVLRHTMFALGTFPTVFSNELRDARAHAVPIDRQILSHFAEAMRLTVTGAISRLEGRH
jgi:hypothetical protein